MLPDDDLAIHITYFKIPQRLVLQMEYLEIDKANDEPNIAPLVQMHFHHKKETADHLHLVTETLPANMRWTDRSVNQTCAVKALSVEGRPVS